MVSTPRALIILRKRQPPISSRWAIKNAHLVM
nr:MAG TPA: hypothetical protein [Caudoviricetes sp.]